MPAAGSGGTRWVRCLAAACLALTVTACSTTVAGQAVRAPGAVPTQAPTQAPSTPAPTGSAPTGPATSTPAPTTPAPGGSSTSTASSPGEIAGTGYSFALPTGWSDITDEVNKQLTSGSLDAAVGAPSADAFRTNVNVVVIPAGTDDLKTTADRVASGLESVSHKPAVPTAGFDLAGSPAIGHSSTSTLDGSPVTYDQYVAIHGDKVYIITVTYAPTEHPAAATALKGITGSWRWTG